MWVPVGFSGSVLGAWPARRLARFCSYGFFDLPALKAARQTCLRIISLLALAFLLPACSAIKIGYNQSPDLAYWYLDAYADFSDAQSLRLKADLGSLQAWHRQTQLPGYAALLQDLQRQIGGDMGPAQACVIFADVRRKLLAVVDQSEPAMTALAATLDASQLQQLERRFAKGNTEYRAEFLDAAPQKVRALRLEKAIRRAEMLYGRLDNQQTALLGRLLDQSVFDAPRAYAERLRRQRDVVQTLKQLVASRTAGVSPAVQTGPTRSALRGLLERSFTGSPDAAFRDYTEKLTADSCRMFAELHNTTSRAQRSKAVEVLSGYETDLRKLAAQSNS
jgi:hypothetical protein